MQSLGHTRSTSRVNRAREKERETHTPAGSRLMADLPPMLAEAIKEWMETAESRPGIRHRALEYIQKLDVNVVATLALQVVLDSLTHQVAYAKVATSIGTRLEDEVRYQAYKDQNPGGFRFALERVDDFSSYGEKRRHILKAMSIFSIETPSWPNEDRVSVGVVVLQLIVETCGLLEIYKVRNGKKEQLRLAPTEEALKWVEDVNERAAQMRPLYLPFVEEPLDWINPMSGGFHSTNVYATSVVKTNNRDYLGALMEAEMPKVYGALNAMQRTKWMVNPIIHEMFTYLWEAGYQAEGLPCRDNEELPPKPANIDTDVDARKAWRAAARQVHDRNHRHCSDRLQTGRLHWVCQRYLEQTFWYCHQMDWRGRVYPVGYYLHPQGQDLVKALLQFGEGKPVVTDEAKLWHQIHGANCWGLDKKPFHERIQWVQENEARLRRIALDPLDDRSWEEADKPWQFLAWCCDWVAILDDPEHVSQLPIHQDATQSGIQIYSLLLRDTEGARATNCLPSEAPQDLYGLVADHLTEDLKEAVAQGDDIARQWLEFGVDRSCTKRPVMTRVYNSTPFSCQKYVQEWAEERAAKEGLKLPKVTEGADAYWQLTKKLWSAMKGVIRGTEEAQAWLSDVATIFSQENLGIHWTTPMGLPVRQYYPSHEQFKVKTLIGEVHRQTKLRREIPEVNAKRMRLAFAPNFIHSLDAAAMMETVHNVTQAGVTSITCNHDSFATLAADSQVLAESTRRAFVDLFSRDLLKELRDELQALIPHRELPPLPEYGSLDVSELEHSLYFFS